MQTHTKAPSLQLLLRQSHVTELVGVNVEWSDNAQYRMQGILSAAFDTIDHTILLGTILFSNGRLENVGNKGMALS